MITGRTPFRRFIRLSALFAVVEISLMLKTVQNRPNTEFEIVEMEQEANRAVTAMCANGCVASLLRRSQWSIVVTRLPAAREDPGSRRAAGKSLCFHENHCDTQLWARAAH